MYIKLFFVGSYALHSSFDWPLKLALAAQALLASLLYLSFQRSCPKYNKIGTSYSCSIASWFISNILLLCISSFPVV